MLNNFERSTWKIFFFLLISSFLILSSAIYFKWQNINEENLLELTYLHKLVRHSVKDRLAQQAMMLRILGTHLATSDFEHEEDNLHVLLDDFLKKNPVFVAYGLAKPDGTLVVTSRNIATKNLPNLLHSPKTSETFKYALESHDITLGRTYFFKPVNDWLIPLRYAIRDHNDRVIAVMNAGILLDGPYNPWNFSNLSDDTFIAVTKDAINKDDYYTQYVMPPIHSGNLEKTYNFPLPKTFITAVKKKLSKTTGKSFEQFKQESTIVSYHGSNSTFGLYTETVSYDPVLKIFTSVGRFEERLILRLLPNALVYTLIFFVFNLLLFMLLRYIDTMQRTHNEKLRLQALHDKLTTLPNRYFLEEMFEQWQERHERFALLYLDLNNFKNINDHYGHLIGDDVLVAIATRLQKASDSQTLLIRHGGDEFIILSVFSDRKQIENYCEHLIYIINEPIVIEQYRFHIGASIGIVEEAQSLPLGNILSHADIAMYEAKRTHQPFVYFSGNLQERSAIKARIENELKNALENREFYIVYQPQIDAKEGHVIGVEALLRWENPKLGTIGPDQFIPVAESTGLILPIGDFVAQKAIEEISALDMDMRLSINVSVNQLLYPGFMQTLDAITQHCRCSPELIVIEVTESIYIEDQHQVRHVLRQLQKQGYTISLDDFGTGFSSLSVLSKMPVDELKIDKSFVRDILEDDHDRALIQSIISIGNSLSIPTLAEGVESSAQAQMLKSYGCDRFQGYYYAKPMPIDELKAYLKNAAK